MMEAFTLDTSGGVLVQNTQHHTESLVEWDDLSPFEQGYIEALFASAGLRFETPLDPIDEPYMDEPSFRHLAPETLARIMEDCRKFAGQLQADYTERQLRTMGAEFWAYRNDRRSLTGFPTQAGWAALSRRARDYPPLTPYLGDDGKIYLREQAA